LAKQKEDQDRKYSSPLLKDKVTPRELGTHPKITFKEHMKPSFMCVIAQNVRNGEGGPGSEMNSMSISSNGKPGHRATFGRHE
jgi:hypothetical protein